MKVFTLFSLVAVAASLVGSAAKADLMQICVDSNSGVYKVQLASVPKNTESFNGILSHEMTASIANGTNLNTLVRSGSLDNATAGSELEGLYYALKHELATVDELNFEMISYGDEPRVYKAGAITLLCSSAINTDDVRPGR